MARMDDSSSDYRRWTNAKLMHEARKTANLENFGVFVYDGINAKGDECTKAIRERTRQYRDTWMNPILDEIERRFVKRKAE